MDTFNRNSIRGRALAAKESKQPLLFDIPKIECPVCEGAGVLYILPDSPKKKCGFCKGTGKI